jgi:hypothetical protein
MLIAVFVFQEFADSKTALFFEFKDIPPFLPVIFVAQFMSVLLNLNDCVLGF